MHSLVRMAYKIIILKFLFGQDCFRDHSKQIVQSTGCDSLNIELTIRAWVTQISSFTEITAFSDHAANTGCAQSQPKKEYLYTFPRPRAPQNRVPVSN
jgi:hypothetical protein